MAKNDFDIDFDFEKEYGFDPDAILDSDYSEEDLDLSEFADDALDMDLENAGEDSFDDYDLDVQEAAAAQIQQESASNRGSLSLS